MEADIWAWRPGVGGRVVPVALTPSLSVLQFCTFILHSRGHHLVAEEWLLPLWAPVYVSGRNQKEVTMGNGESCLWKVRLSRIFSDIPLMFCCLWALVLSCKGGCKM